MIKMQSKRRWWVLWLAAFIVLQPSTVFASEGHGVSASIWLALALILLAAKLGGELAVRLNQPAVLGELCGGILLGNVHLLGLPHMGFMAALPEVAFLAELGVVLLLFEVGLESTVAEMKHVAPQSGIVAIIGVVAPMLLGYGASSMLVPEGSTTLHLFVGATLCATSVGITARVLKDLGALSRAETKVILGAAVIDDVLGLVVLAVVSAIAQQGSIPSAGGLGRIMGLAFGFLAASLVLGRYGMPSVFKGASKLRTSGVLPALAIAVCLLLSGLSAMAGLAAIVGAFAAGLILDEVHVKPFGKQRAEDLAHLVAPLVGILGPIFFVRTGMMVELSGANWTTLGLATALSIVAVIGKLVTGLGVRGTGVDRLTVGIGMIPRGEVGLIFANVGAAIRVDGHPLIEPSVYMAVVLMVMATTVITPPWLASRLRKLGAVAPEPPVPSIPAATENASASA